MPKAKKRAAAAPPSVPAVGDIVLANHSGQQDSDDQEPALVVKVGCEYSDDDDDSKKKKKKKKDGIMVKFQVSNTRVVLPAASVYQLVEEKSFGRKSRSSSRASRTQTQAEKPSSKSSSNKEKETQTAKPSSNSSSNKKKDQGVVTPTNNTTTSEDENEDDSDVVMEDTTSTKKEAPPKKRGRSVTPKATAINNSSSSKKVPKKKRAVSQPSKAKAKTKVTATKGDTTDEDKDNDSTSSSDNKEGTGVTSPYFEKVKPSTTDTTNTTKKEAPAAKKKAPVKKKAPKMKEKTEASDDDADDDDEVVVAKAAAKAKAPPAKKKKKAAPAKKKKAAAKVVVIDSDHESDNDDDEDKPYKAEYATTGRATCRRCDSLIAKESLRVSHVPLFRGKPGFRVYRHLQCIVFSDIENVEDIGGWKRIKRKNPEDFEKIVARVEESKVEVLKEQEEITPDELVQVAFQGETRKPPPGLTANLLPFQTEGVSWMYHQEVKLPELRGGILADEMGMGKTLQTITTMLDNRPRLQHSKPGAKHPPSVTSADLEDRVRESKLWDIVAGEWKHEMEMVNVPKKLWSKKGQLGSRAGTLVICPVIALSQWKTELEKFTEPATFTIATYHGPNRAKELPLQKLLKYDIILTTYQVLEQDFRKMVSPNKVTCPNCGGKYKADKLRVHLKYFCGEGAQKTEAQARQQRTADRPNNVRGNGGGSGGGKGGTKGSLKKKEFPQTATKKTATTKQKSTIKNANGKRSRSSKSPAPKKKQTESSDSESEKDDDETEIVEVSPTTGRPSRSAARTASKLMSASMKEWTAGEAKAGDDDSFGDVGGDNSASDDDDDEDSMVYDEEDSDGEVNPSEPKFFSQKKETKKKSAKQSSASESGDSDSESSEDEAALARVRKRQKQALSKAKKVKSGKKTFVQAKKGGKAAARGKGKGKKKFDDDDDESSDDESDEEERDPLEGIDLEALMKDAMEGSRMSLLHSVCWWRVVLDEAHFIKSRSSQTAAAAFSLIGVNRWGLSGTPLQNRVGELYSLIRFLRIDPMAHYFCRSKGCDCKSIHYRIKNGRCQDCNHGSVQHFSHFNKHILNPIQRDGYSGDGRMAMFKLKNEVLDRCLLRRTKETRAEDMNLPPRIVSIRSIQLHPIEKDFYDALYTQTKSSFSDYVAQGTLLNNYAHIFDLLTKLRQAVNHPYLIVYSKRNMERAGSTSSDTEQQIANGSTDCDICHETPIGRVVSSCCGAAFCRSCVIEYMSVAITADDGTPCPSCRAPFSIDLNQAEVAIEDDSALDLAPPGSPSASSPKSITGVINNGPSLKELSHINSGSILRRINLAEFATSTKIEALVQELVQMRKANPGSKALVFSQFVNMLDLIRWRLHCDPCLKEMGLGVRILHGSMNRKARDAALKDFREDNSVRVMLMSLKSGGVALNLTVASQVYLMDNWWNPAAEMQAIDRTHRLGQHRCIRAVRFIAEGTVEERVLQLQEKKRLVFDGTVGRDAGSLKMLNSNDMASLFT